MTSFLVGNTDALKSKVLDIVHNLSIVMIFIIKKQSLGVIILQVEIGVSVNIVPFSFCHVLVALLLALSQEATIGHARSGTPGPERSCAPWRATGMWSTP